MSTEWNEIWTEALNRLWEEELGGLPDQMRDRVVKNPAVKLAAQDYSAEKIANGMKLDLKTVKAWLSEAGTSLNHDPEAIT